MNNPFETIKHLLGKKRLTADEKRRMKTMLISYIGTHPVKSGLLSPYTFRYVTLALASLVLVLGGSIGLSSASYQALPNDKLYPIKLWIEEYQAKNQKTPESIIAFETKRIETRFKEATHLAVTQELDDTLSTTIQAGIEHSRAIIKNVAEDVQEENPELALAAANTLETTFSSNGKILATIEQNTHQIMGPIVLAAQITTKALATEKTKFEQIVALKSDDTTKDSAEKRLLEVETLLAQVPKEPLMETVSLARTTSSEKLPPESPSEISLATVTTMSLVAEDPTEEPLLDTQEVPEPVKTPQEQVVILVTEAKSKMMVGSHSEALVLIEKAGQILNELKLTKSLEQTYQVDTTKKPTLE